GQVLLPRDVHGGAADDPGDLGHPTPGTSQPTAIAVLTRNLVGAMFDPWHRHPRSASSARPTPPPCCWIRSASSFCPSWPSPTRRAASPAGSAFPASGSTITCARSRLLASSSW